MRASFRYFSDGRFAGVAQVLTQEEYEAREAAAASRPKRPLQPGTCIKGGPHSWRHVPAEKVAEVRLLGAWDRCEWCGWWSQRPSEARP